MSENQKLQHSSSTTKLVWRRLARTGHITSTVSTLCITIKENIIRITEI